MRMKEINGLLHYQCPHCSRSYEAEKDQAGTLVKVGSPANCSRCGCPMDETAQAFSEERARGEHNPAISAIGAQMRGIQSPPVDAMMRKPVVSE